MHMPAKTKKTAPAPAAEAIVVDPPEPVVETKPVFILPAIPTAKEPLMVEIKKLATDLDTQPRVSLDPNIVAEYAELIKNAKKDGKPYPLPPISCVRTPEGKIIPYDGFQRILANKGIHSEIIAECVEGSELMAVMLCLSANAAHGSRRTTRDKQNAVKRAFKDENLSTLSDSAIAELCAVSTSMVKEHRPAAKSTGVRVSKSGKKIDTSGIGKKGGTKPKAAKKEKAKTAAAITPDPEKAQKSDGAKQTKANERLSIVLARVEKNIGGAKGVEFRSGILDESIELSLKELTELSGYTPETTRAILPLIVAAKFKPAKAFDFFKADLSEKTLEELALKALCHDGKYIFAHKAVTVIAESAK